MNKLRMRRPQLKSYTESSTKINELLNIKCMTAIAITCVNSSLIRGYNVACIYSVRSYIDSWAENKSTDGTHMVYNTRESKIGFTYHANLELSYGLGALIGNLFVPNIAEKFGRKGGILLINIISIFGVLFSGYSKLFNMPYFLFIGRLLLGAHCGINMCLAPLYMIELVPRKWRGKIGALNALFCNFGELLGIIVCDAIDIQSCWPLLFSLVIIPTILQLWILPIFPESPKYTFVMKNKVIEARKAFKWIRGQDISNAEHQELIYELIQHKQLGSITLRKFANHTILLRALLITVVITCGPPLCGIRILVGYVASGALFVDHDPDTKSFLQEISRHFILMIVSFFNIFFVDMISRQKLLIISFSIMSISCVIIWSSVVYFPNVDQSLVNVITLIYMMAFKGGVGYISYFISSEYFNTATVPLADSIGQTIAWFMRCIERAYMQKIEVYLNNNLLLHYGILNGALVFFCYKFVYDTRDVQLKALYQKINKNVYT